MLHTRYKYRAPTIIISSAGGVYLGDEREEYPTHTHILTKQKTEISGFPQNKIHLGVVSAFFLSQIYRSWGLVAHRGWARLMLDRKCLIEVPNAPRHRAERTRQRRGDHLRQLLQP